MAATLAQPITFANSGKTAENRFLKSAMTERQCTWSDGNLDECGKPTLEYLKLYEEWSRGQIGIIVLGNIPCDRRYPEAPGNAIMDPLNPWDPVEAFKPVIVVCKAHGSLCIGQVTHPGRQTFESIAPTPVSSSDVQSPSAGSLKFGKPRPMTIDEIKDTVQRFAFAAKVLYDVSADGIQLHAAHGYLLSQFLSPRVNLRTDEYGGSFDNRSRIIFEIADAIRKRVPDKSFMLTIKINSQDFIEGGFSAEECREMCLRLEHVGFDLIELSGGTYESLAFWHKKDSTKRRESFFIEFADLIRPHLKSAKLAVTGGFRSTKAMAQAIQDGSTDIIGLGRPLAADFQLPVKLLSGEVDAAKPNLVDEQLSTASASYQMREVVAGKQPSDLSDPEVAKTVEAAIKARAQAAA